MGSKRHIWFFYMILLVSEICFADSIMFKDLVDMGDVTPVNTEVENKEIQNLPVVPEIKKVDFPYSEYVFFRIKKNEPYSFHNDFFIEFNEELKKIYWFLFYSHSLEGFDGQEEKARALSDIMRLSEYMSKTWAYKYYLEDDDKAVLSRRFYGKKDKTLFDSEMIKALTMMNDFAAYRIALLDGKVKVSEEYERHFQVRFNDFKTRILNRLDAIWGERVDALNPEKLYKSRNNSLDTLQASTVVF